MRQHFSTRKYLATGWFNKSRRMNKKIIISIFTTALLITGCSKDTDVFIPDATPGPDTSWQPTIIATMPVIQLRNSLLLPAFTDSVEISSNAATLNTPIGMQVIFPPNCCVSAAGIPVTGKIQVEFMSLKKKGDMIRMNRPTTHGDSLLITAGELFIRLKKEGAPALLAPGVKLYIRYTDLPTNPAMKLFFGDETNPEAFNWLANNDPQNNFINAGTQAYEIYTNHLRWINIASIQNTSSVPTVKIAADLAPYFTNTNTIAFTVFKDQRSVAGMPGNLAAKKFLSTGLPLGKPVTVVVISKLANDYYLGYESAVTSTPGSGAPYQSVSIRPVKKTLPEILAYLGSL